MDGINVAFTAIVDIDMSGVDLLCAQYGIQVDDKLRHRMNTIYQIVMDSSMILFSPVVAVASYAMSRYLQNNLSDHDHAGAYVVFECEAREFQSTHFFMFQLRDSN